MGEFIKFIAEQKEKELLNGSVVKFRIALENLLPANRLLLESKETETLVEGKYVSYDSKIGVRVDSERTGINKTHGHILVRGKDTGVSWNQDGTRHDAKKFPAKVLDVYRDAARKALKLPDDMVLEAIECWSRKGIL